jgi:hypothetical protein
MTRGSGAFGLRDDTGIKWKYYFLTSWVTRSAKKLVIFIDQSIFLVQIDRLKQL